jgi:uncharacterized protein (TIGR02246 family)
MEQAADEQAVRDLLMRYFVGLDRRDAAIFEEVFTPDARMSVLGGAQTFAGRTQIITALMNVAQYPMSSHHPTSQQLTLDGDHGRADTFAVAYLVTRDAHIVVRGLQYLDEVERTAEGWRIRTREHIPQWQSESPAAPVALPG